MMNKTGLRIMALLSVLMLTPLGAWAATGDTFTALTEEGVEVAYYVVSETDKTCRVNGSYSAAAVSTATTGTVTIPAEVNGYTVTQLNNYSFYKCASIERIVLPEGLKYIYDSSFNGMTSLKQVNIPSTVTSMGRYVFEGCSSLTEVSLPEGISDLGDGLFQNATVLQSVTIPSTVTSIKRYVFKNCKKLDNVVLPDNLSSISEEAFYGCSALKQIAIPDKIFTLNRNTFYNCTSLTEVVFKGNIISIGESCFERCSSLASITLQSGLRSIYTKAFCSCTKLKTVNIEENDQLISIPEYAFSGCTSLESFDFTAFKSLATINANAFNGAKLTGDVTFPSTVTTIGADAFYGCTSVTDVWFKGGDPTIDWKSTSTYDFNKPTGTTLHVKEGLLASIETGTRTDAFQKWYAANSSCFTEFPLENGDMFTADLNMTDDNGAVTGTITVGFTVTDMTDGSRKAVIYSPSYAQAYSEDTYLTKGKSAISATTGTAGRLVLPSVVTDRGGHPYTLTAIGAYGLSDGTMTGIEFPKTITKLGDYALYNSSKIGNTLVIPQTIAYIGNYTFKGCTSIREVYFMHTNRDQISWNDSYSGDGFGTSSRTFMYVGNDIYRDATGNRNNAVSAAFYCYYTSGIFHLTFKEWDPTHAGMDFTETLINVDASREFEAPLFRNVLKVPVTFSSDQPGVADVDSEGNITLGNELGTATISAHFDGNEDYAATTETCVIAVRGPATLGEQTPLNACPVLTEYTRFVPSKYQFTENTMWEMPSMMCDEFYTSLFWHSNNITYRCETLVDPYTGDWGDEYLQMTYNPVKLFPYWGIGAANDGNWDKDPGQRMGGLIAFRVPAGKAKIVVHGFTENDNARMGICLAGCEVMEFAGGTPRDIVYEYDSEEEAYAYVYGISLSPNQHGYISLISWVPEGYEAPGGTLAVNGVWVTDSNDDVLGDGTVSYESYTKTLTLNNANIVATDRNNAIMAFDRDLRIELVGTNVLSSSREAALSYGYYKNEEMGGGNLTIASYDGGTLTLTSGGTHAGIESLDANINIEGCTVTVNGDEVAIKNSNSKGSSSGTSTGTGGSGLEVGDEEVIGGGGTAIGDEEVIGGGDVIIGDGGDVIIGGGDVVIDDGGEEENGETSSKGYVTIYDATLEMNASRSAMTGFQSLDLYEVEFLKPENAYFKNAEDGNIYVENADGAEVLLASAIIGPRPAIELEPVAEETLITFDNEDDFVDENDQPIDLSNTVIDNTYFSIDNTSADGNEVAGYYDSTEGCIVINQTTTPEQMDNVVNEIPGCEVVVDNFNGVIIQLPAGSGAMTVAMVTEGSCSFTVQIGDNEPTSRQQPTQGDMVVDYDVQEDTYAYIYASEVSTGGAKPALAPRRAPAAAANCVKIYSIKVSPTGFALNVDEGGYATYYNSKAVRLPAGVKAATVDAVDGEQLTLNYRYDGDNAAANVVPGGTAVLVSAAKDNYILTVVNDDTQTAPAGNLLHGSDTETITYGGDTYYKLTWSADNTSFGFYWGAADGAAFLSPAHKAWLALPSSLAKSFGGFSLDNVATAIQTLEDSGTSKRSPNGDVFDLQGRKTSGAALRKGIYIRDGKKIVIK